MRRQGMSIRARRHPIRVTSLPDRLVHDAWWLVEPQRDETSSGRSDPLPHEAQVDPAALCRLIASPSIGAFRT